MRVSVVIPSYNHRGYVIQAIESVLEQTWPEIDLIVVDDGSSDGSPEIIRDLFEKHGGFRFVARENRGLLKTLNEGLAMAQGEFFCELASDDYFPSESIERRVRFLLEHPEYVAVFGEGAVVQDDKLTGETFNTDRTRDLLEKENPIPDMISGSKPVFCTGLVRTDVLRRIGGFDEETFRYYEDLDTPIRLALAGRLGLVDGPVIFRRQHNTNVSSYTSHIRLEKALFYAKLLKDPRMVPYRKLLKYHFRRSLLALGRELEKKDHGLSFDNVIFSNGWAYLWREPRLFKYLVKASFFKNRAIIKK